MSCNIGAGVTAIHDTLRDLLARAGVAAGFRTLCEQVIPDLASGNRQEPRVDVEAWGHSTCANVLLDVTVPDPFAVRYNRSEHKQHVPPTIDAELQKNNEYPRTGDAHVRGVAVDLLGHIGPQLEGLLHEWAALARQRDLAFGVSGRRWIACWRAQISAAVARGVARQVQTAQRWAGAIAARQHYTR